jgi:MFS family permease
MPRPGAGRLLSANFVAVSAASVFFHAGHSPFFLVTSLYLDALGGSEAEIGLIFGLVAIGSLITRPIAGPLIQWWGSRAVITLALALVVVAAGTLTAATGVLMIFAGRMVTGIYNGLFQSASTTYVADVAPPARRGTALGLFMNATILNAVAGPPVTLAILEWTGARPLEGTIAGLLGRAPYDLNFYTIFLVSIALAVLGLACTRFMRPTGDAGRRSGAPGRGWGGVFHRPALFLAVVAACTFVNQIAIFAFIPLMTERTDLGNFGYYFALQALAGVAVRFASGPLSDRHGAAVVVLPGLALMAAGSALVALSASAPLFYLAGVVWGLGFGAAQTALLTYLVDHVPAEVRSTAISTYTLGQDIGIGVGGAALGALLQATDFTVVYLASALVVLAGTALFAVGHRRAWSGPDLRAPRSA